MKFKFSFTKMFVLLGLLTLTPAAVSAQEELPEWLGVAATALSLDLGNNALDTTLEMTLVYLGEGTVTQAELRMPLGSDYSFGALGHIQVGNLESNVPVQVQLVGIVPASRKAEEGFKFDLTYLDSTGKKVTRILDVQWDGGAK